MEASQVVKEAMARVGRLREICSSDPALQSALIAVKSLQSQRFRGTYRDLLMSADYIAATRFFLTELYSDKDYTERDSQFARIAGAIQTLFPQSVVDTAVLLARLHRLSEELDFEMAQVWRISAGDSAARYVHCWRIVDQAKERHWQLSAVLQLGQDLHRLTRKPGLRLMLRMMRGPARAAGLGSLQSFLEAGFDTFASMASDDQLVEQFLATIHERESRWMDALFGPDTPQSTEALRACIAAEHTLGAAVDA